MQIKISELKQIIAEELNSLKEEGEYNSSIIHAPPGLSADEYINLALDCLDQAGVSVGVQGKVKALVQLKEVDNPDGAVDEVAPPGFEKVVKGLKKNKEVDNPWAVAWSMKNKGFKPHKGSSKK